MLHIDFITEFVYFIVGTETEPETEDTQSDHRLRRRLVERCHHMSDEACIPTPSFAHFLSGVITYSLTV